MMNKLSPHIEPRVRIGLSENGKFGLRLCGKYDISASDTGIIYSPLDSESFIEVEGLEIGKNFHWQRERKMCFAGTMKVRKDTSGNVTLINIIGAEQYLASVIGSEMNPKAPLELLKAHAIISRSWLLRMIYYPLKADSDNRTITSERIIDWTEADSHSNFDVCADDHCQRYQGMDCVSEVSREAVESTRGMVLVDSQGNVADARFSKCCGGRTEIYSSCWGDEYMDYLIGLNDEFCSPAKLKDIGGEQLLATLVKDYDAESTDYYFWEESVPEKLIADNLMKYYGISVGKPIRLMPVKTGSSGRITELRIEGTQGAINVGKELCIRKLLSDTHLKSSWFTIAKEGDDFLLKGRGWGHGVGLCQIGAATMAADGWDYHKILEYYYPGLKLEKIYG